MRKVSLAWKMIIGIATGILFALLFKEYVPYIEWMGTVFLRVLKMIMIPLVLSSLITGVSSISSAGSLGRIGLKTIGYYFLTSMLAIITGMLLINIFHPGTGANLSLTGAPVISDLNAFSVKDTLVSIVPENIFSSIAEGEMLPVIFTALFFGFFITRLQEKQRILLTDFFASIFELTMKVTLFIMKLAPLGIFGLVAKLVSQQHDVAELFQRLGIYMLLVIGALFIHAMITLPSILLLIGRINPLKHYGAMSTPLITAFSTASSNAALPLTMEAVKNRAGVSNKITSFTLPLGATINMDGTALFEVVAALFIAQVYGLDLSAGQQFQMALTALLASIGAAGIPMAGLVMMAIVLSVVGLPIEAVGLILAVDPILDMCRTTVNVLSDSCGAVVIAKSEGEILKV
jgi:proton glutamate symport protein